ncbi:MAG: hypothetical protein ACRDOV_02390 [Streptomyces sp.]
MTDQPLDHDVDGGEFDDFDAWRQAQRAKRGQGKRVRIFGRVVEMPTSLPLGLSLDLDELATSSEREDLERIVGEIYGADALDHWVSGDADVQDLQVLLAYGIAVASGMRDITFARAAEMVADLQRKAAEGQLPGKARKKSKKRGPGGGSPATGR